jgi:hypothetical protein
MALREPEEESMKYLLTFIADQSRMKDAVEEEMRTAMDAWNAFDKEAVEAGVLIACEPLEWADDATSIRIDQPIAPSPMVRLRRRRSSWAGSPCSMSRTSMRQ